MANFFDLFNPLFRGFQIGSYGFDDKEAFSMVPEQLVVQPREAQVMTNNSASETTTQSSHTHTERLAKKHGLTVEQFLSLEQPVVQQDITNVVALFSSWPDDQRCAPNEILRSSLFAVVKKGERAPLQDVKITAWGDDEVYFTGVQLDQYDLDVWLQLLHIYRESKMGTKVYFTLREFLKALGKTPTGPNAKALKLSFARLQAGGVRLRSISARRSYQGSLIAEIFEDEEVGKWCVIINEKMLPLFTHATTWLNWEIRKGLTGPLSKWLMGWICSHEAKSSAPQRIKLENIQKLSGCSYEHRWDLKRDVVKALKELKEKAIIQSWEFQKDILLVTRLPKMIQP